MDTEAARAEWDVDIVSLTKFARFWHSQARRVGDGILSWCTLTFPYLKLSMAAFWVSELRIEGVIEEIIVRTVLVILNTIS